MCYLPISCLKTIVIVGSFFSIGVSIAILVAAIYANNEKKDIIDNSDQGFIDASLIVVYVLSILFLLLGLCGLYGGCKTRKKHNRVGNCLLGVYFIGIFIFFLLFAGGSIFFFVGPSSIIGDNCQEGSKTQLIKSLYEANSDAEDAFCKEQCPCRIDNNSSSLAVWLTQNGYSVNVGNETYTNYQTCTNKNDEDQSSVILLGIFEQLLDCGGWCQQDNSFLYFLKFSDINHCTSEGKVWLIEECLKEKDSCYNAFKSFLTDKGLLFGFVSLIAMGISLLNVITVCCLCYHPGKQRGMKNFYSRMLDEN